MFVNGSSIETAVVSSIFYQTRPSSIEYIDKTFRKTLPYFQILVKESLIRQISGCTFDNIEEDFDYIITLEQEVLMNDDVFQYDEQQTNQPAPINVRYNGQLTLRNCSFNNARSRTVDGGNVFFCGVDFTIEVYFISCQFHNCGSSKDFAIISIQNPKSKINLYNCSFIYDSSDSSSIALSSKCMSAYFDECQFNNTRGITISRTGITDPSEFAVTSSVFDSCGSDTMNYLNLALGQPSLITFENNVISNIVRNEGQKFTLYMTADRNIQELQLTNVSFINNSCCSLFGGGVGLYIEKTISILFFDCKFINNKAGSDNSNRNSMLSEIDPNYRAGDGGGVQLGFLRNLKESAIKFEQCEFRDNKAIRHGGALAIQTTSTVEIINCTFESNSANSNIDSFSLELLWENHFDKKTQGRGGAIYINPAFSYTSSSSSGSDFSMVSVSIRECTFSMNLALDGYAIYIEGDDPGTTFEFLNNKFYDNFNADPDNDPNITERGIIATEIHRILKKDVRDNNEFSNNQISANQKDLVYVDHYGNIMPTLAFSESFAFTYSNQFSHSSVFSNSNQFTQTSAFTNTDSFSHSDVFTDSKTFPTSRFTSSDVFSFTNKFSESNLFSDSEKFTESHDFSHSSPFSKSQVFSPTEKFSKTGFFSLSALFTKSNEFSVSSLFTESNQFSQSKEFSGSNPFSESGQFSKTEYFSLSTAFTKSNEFSVSNLFSESNQFSQSKEFSGSNVFSESGHFSKTDHFSLSTLFTKSSKFSVSELFTYSGKFSLSIVFSLSNPFSETSQFSKSDYFSLSTAFSKSKEFSDSYQFTESDIFSFSNQFSSSKLFSESSGFSETGKFTETGEFSFSASFSKSSEFSDSESFTDSSKFSPSDVFSKSSGFSETGRFTETGEFSFSTIFSKSSEFSDSDSFTDSGKFSSSKMFTKSGVFSETGRFTETGKFSFSDAFSKSSEFSDSASFSKSSGFSISQYFSNSEKFSETGQFSMTNDFSHSIHFSVSSEFSHSKEFSKSKEFSQSRAFSETGFFSATDSFTLTEKFTFSQLFTISQDFSLSKGFTTSMHFTHSDHFSRTDHFSETERFSLTEKFSLTNDFSYSTEFTNSFHFTRTSQFSSTAAFSSSEQFSHSIHFTHSESFTHSDAFSQSKPFTSSPTFSLSTKFTNSRPFSITSDFSVSNQFSKSYIFSHTYDFSESYAFTPSASLIPNDPLCSIIDELGNMTLSDRCEYEGSENHKVTVEITRSNFTDFNNNNDGGAIHVKNCDVRCNGTHFINCSSNEGGGGGVFINNTLNNETSIDLINLTFINCNAMYGGAVFIRAMHESSRILVLNCLFDSNRAYGIKSDTKLYGGSSLFLATHGANVTDCVFLHSKGQGGAVKIEKYDFGLNYNSNRRVKQLEENAISISITGCDFDEDKESQISIFDASGNEGENVELINCNFKGKSAKEANYIDDEKNGINKHKFNDTSVIRNYIGFDDKKKVENNQKKMKNESSIFVVALLAIFIILLAFAFVKINGSTIDDDDENDDFNHDDCIHHDLA